MVTARNSVVDHLLARSRALGKKLAGSAAIAPPAPIPLMQRWPDLPGSAADGGPAIVTPTQWPGPASARDTIQDGAGQPANGGASHLAEAPKGDTSVNDQLDVTVHDNEVLSEIEMMTNLIIATSESDGPLPQPRIDEILGVLEDVPPV